MMAAGAGASTALVARQLSRLALRPDALGKQMSLASRQQSHFSSIASSSGSSSNICSNRHRYSIVDQGHAPLRVAQRCTHQASAAYIPPSSDRSIGLGNLQPLFPPKKRKRVGRGDSSGRGGTATRGHKGQKARAGNKKPKPGFTGGQTPIMRQFPKRGFTNHFAKDYAGLSLVRIQQWIDEGRLDPSQPITARELYQSKCVHNYKDGIKLLGMGASQLTTPIDIVVSKASSLAIAAVEQAGGNIVCKYYTPASLYAHVNEHKFEGRLPPRDPDPVAKKDLLYYASAANRGYLATRVPTDRPRQSPKYLTSAAAAALADEEKARTASGNAEL